MKKSIILLVLSLVFACKDNKSIDVDSDEGLKNTNSDLIDKKNTYDFIENDQSKKQKDDKSDEDITISNDIVIKKSKPKAVNSIIIPELISETNAIKYSQIVDSTTVVKLETNKQCLIGSPAKIKIFNNSIYILDNVSKLLLEFSIEGEFIRSFGKKGKGPGEYIMPFSFDINEKTKEMIIYDRARRTLLSYNLNGQFKFSTKLSFSASNFVLSESFDEYVFDTHLVGQRTNKNSDTKYYSLIITDLKGKVISKILETNVAQNTLMYKSMSSLYRSDNSKILFNQPFTNTIIQINKKNYSTFFEINFEGKTIPEKFNYNIKFSEFYEKIKQNKFQYLDNMGGYYILNDNLFFSAKTKESKENFIYNLKSGELNLIDRKTDNLSFGFLGTKICTYKNSLVNFASPSMFINSKKFKSEKYKNTLVQDIINQTKEGDNPILIFNWFKS